jgi:hypothetical protein
MPTLECWKCGASLADEPLPLARETRCRSCGADQHVCRLCLYFQTGIANECREPIAERVVDKARANFCGYFMPRPGAYRPAADASGSRAALDALFGGAAVAQPAPDTATAARAALEDLFGKP